MGISAKSCTKISRAVLVSALLFAIGTVTPSIVAANPVATTSGCIASSHTWVNSALPQVVAGTFRLEFDATPASTGINGVIGLSSGPAGSYTSLAAIVRFNSTGTIDAMNGSAYTAVAAIRYSAGTSYHFILDVNLTSHTYNASVVVNGTQAVIGTKLAFRSPQAKVSSLSNLAAVAASGSQTICNVTLTLTSSGCMASSAAWVNSALPQPVAGTFRVEFDATPASTGINGVVGLSSGPASAYTSLAAIVRFNPTGTIDAMNGSAYTAAAAIRYSAGTNYHFILDVNLTGHTYDASVVVNGAQVVIGTKLAFRSEQAAVSSLSNLAAVAASGSQTICNVVVPALPVTPSVTTQPLSQTVNVGQTATFSVAGTGTAPMSYQWRKNGAAISGATASAYQTPATTTSDSGSLFSVVVSNSAGSVTSGGATLTVKSPTVAPSITAQPLGQTVTAGQAATFSVAASGTAPNYQWQKNGAAISGATASTYQTPATTTSDSGSLFSVVVSNSAGSVTSGGATLTVKSPTVAPSITAQPLSQTVTAGQTATFSVAASGTAPNYQWQKNGAAISGATASTYQTPVTAVSDNGSQFTVVISNSASSVTSNPATLTVTSPGCVVSSASWVNSALAQVEAGIFRLEFDATPASTGIDGVVGLSSGPAGDYTNLAAIVRLNSTGTIDARNGAGYTAAAAIPYSAATSYHFTLDVNLTAHTYNASVVVNGSPLVIGTNLAFRSEQAGVSSLSNVGAVATSGSQTICNVKISAVAPSITTQPLSQTIIPGQTATFSVAGTGTAPISYQWEKNGTAISGATSSTYQTPAATVSDNGSQFTVVISNSAGSVTSSSGTLTVSAGTFLLAANPSQVSFGSVNVSSNNVQNVMVTNSGSSNITISSVLVSGAGFNAGGGIAGLVLTPGQAAPLSVTFAPAAAGTVSGSVTVKSNATNSPIMVVLSGTGVAQAHLVNLSWTPSTSSVTGYNVYSSRVSGGPYVKLNSTPMAMTSYTDATVQPGLTYYYVTTAIASTGGTESGFSAEASAIIP